MLLLISSIFGFTSLNWFLLVLSATGNIGKIVEPYFIILFYYSIIFITINIAYRINKGFTLPTQKILLLISATLSVILCCILIFFTKINFDVLFILCACALSGSYSVPIFIVKLANMIKKWIYLDVNKKGDK